MSKTKILLLYPPDSDSMCRENLFFPIGIVSLASFIKEKGLEVKVFSSTDYSLRKIHRVVKENTPDVVGISCDSNNRLNCFKVAQAIKLINKNIHVVLGGIHATFFHKQILERISSIDFVVRGEGEITFFELVRALKYNLDLSSIAGISYRIRKQVKVNHARSFLDNLDNLPFLSYELFDMGKIESRLFDPWLVQLTRGCPFNCRFCSDVGMWRRRYRKKSIERSLEELRLFRYKYKINKFSFIDLLPTCDTDWMMELCRGMISNNLGMKWMCFSKAGNISIPLLELMRNAGCEYILYGIESFSERMLRRMNKGYNVDMAIKTLNLTQEIGITSAFTLLFGFPGETEDTLAETLSAFGNLHKGVKCSAANIFQPHPGSTIYIDLKKTKLINDEIWFTNFSIYDYIKFIYRKPMLDAIYRVVNEIESSKEKFSKRYEWKKR